MIVNFSEQDIAERRNYVDLLEDGDFLAEFVCLNDDVEDLDLPIDYMTAYGIWNVYNEEGYVSLPGVLTIYVIEHAGKEPPTYREVIEGKVSAGRVFNCGWWVEWIVEKRE